MNKLCFDPTRWVVAAPVVHAGKKSARCSNCRIAAQIPLFKHWKHEKCS